jgi:manganese-dependent inorganic pyrophosphatase
MVEVIYVVGHKSPDTDSICSAMAYAELKNVLEGNRIHKPARLGEINPETKFALDYFKAKAPEFLKTVKNKQLILVDHSETKQMHELWEKAEIFEIIDHHKIGDVQTTRPILFHAEPVGSTATIITEFYFYHKVKLTKQMAGLLLSAILSDTVVFKSPTTTEKDRLMSKKLAKLAEVDMYDYGIEMKKAKSSIKDLSDEDVIFADFKEYDIAEKKIGIGQIEVVDSAESIQRKAGILKKMNEVSTKRKYHSLFLMITDIMKEATDLWVVGEDLEKIEKAYSKLFKENTIYIEGMMSRKKDLLPVLMKVLK